MKTVSSRPDGVLVGDGPVGLRYEAGHGAVPFRAADEDEVVGVDPTVLDRLTLTRGLHDQEHRSRW